MPLCVIIARNMNEIIAATLRLNRTLSPFHLSTEYNGIVHGYRTNDDIPTPWPIIILIIESFGKLFFKVLSWQHGIYFLRTKTEHRNDDPQERNEKKTTKNKKHFPHFRKLINFSAPTVGWLLVSVRLVGCHCYCWWFFELFSSLVKWPLLPLNILTQVMFWHWTFASTKNQTSSKRHKMQSSPFVGSRQMSRRSNCAFPGGSSMDSEFPIEN